MANATCSINDNCTTGGRLVRGWCSKHYNRWRRWGDPLFALTIYGDDERRFWSKVDKNGPVPARRPDLGPCWTWTGNTDRAGYGLFSLGKSGCTRAHRWICELKSRPVPDGYEPDHLCFNTSCVNYESHLEVVPQQVNILRSNGLAAINARKTRCKRNHLLDEANTRIRANGSRVCKACERLRPRKPLSDKAKAAKNAARRAETAAKRAVAA